MGAFHCGVDEASARPGRLRVGQRNMGAFLNLPRDGRGAVRLHRAGRADRQTRACARRRRRGVSCAPMDAGWRQPRPWPADGRRHGGAAPPPDGVAANRRHRGRELGTRRPPSKFCAICVNAAGLPPEHAPRGPFTLLERRHALAKIVGRRAGVLVER